jgi:hypothetical protein
LQTHFVLPTLCSIKIYNMLSITLKLFNSMFYNVVLKYHVTNLIANYSLGSCTENIFPCTVITKNCLNEHFVLYFHYWEIFIPAIKLLASIFWKFHVHLNIFSVSKHQPKYHQTDFYAQLTLNIPQVSGDSFNTCVIGYHHYKWKQHLSNVAILGDMIIPTG